MPESEPSTPLTDGQPTVVAVDYKNPAHREAFIRLLDHYARDPMGGGEALDAELMQSLPDKLAELSVAHSWLAWIEQEDGGQRAVGLMNAFQTFSTFAAAPILNIHDLVVEAEYRGRGISTRLFDAAEQFAIQQGYCKLTLEVLSNNLKAQQAYRRIGFSPYQLDPKAGEALFWQKTLPQ